MEKITILGKYQVSDIKKLLHCSKLEKKNNVKTNQNPP